MKNLKRFAVLFCVSTTISSYSQIGTGGYQINNEEATIVALPEVLLSFDAVFDSKKVELTWSSNTENNNNFYAVEKSKDGIAFEKIVSIKAFGNNSSLISYFEADFTPFNGISYYRLSQTDIKGKVLSSRIVSVNNINATSDLSMISDEKHTNNLQDSENKEVLLVLRNQKGEESYSKAVVDQENNLVVSNDNESKLDIGTYVVIASSDNKFYSQKVVIK